jgi:hypothetical protein
LLSRRLSLRSLSALLELVTRLRRSIHLEMLDLFLNGEVCSAELARCRLVLNINV